MKARVILASASLAILIGVALSGVLLAPERLRPWLWTSAGLAAITGLQSIASDPRDIGFALLFTLPPLIALTADGSPTWLIGPLAALLLLAGELNALSWACQAAGTMSPVKRRRLARAGQLTALGLVVAVIVAVVTSAA